MHCILLRNNLIFRTKKGFTYHSTGYCTAESGNLYNENILISICIDFKIKLSDIVATWEEK